MIAYSSKSNNIERTGTRCSAYSTWHRTIPGIAMIDIDSVETCRKCQSPLALIEIFRTGGIYNINTKPVSILKNLAKLSGLPAYILEYDTTPDGLLSSIKARQVTLTNYPLVAWSIEEWINIQLFLRNEHSCT